jgi:hypothetical protein
LVVLALFPFLSKSSRNTPVLYLLKRVPIKTAKVTGLVEFIRPPE